MSMLPGYRRLDKSKSGVFSTYPNSLPMLSILIGKRIQFHLRTFRPVMVVMVMMLRGHCTGGQVDEYRRTKSDHGLSMFGLGQVANIFIEEPSVSIREGFCRRHERKHNRRHVLSGDISREKPQSYYYCPDTKAGCPVINAALVSRSNYGHCCLSISAVLLWLT